MNKELQTTLTIHALQEVYEVIGGEDVESVRVYRESSDMYDIRSKTRCVRSRVPMILMKDNNDDALPLFMMKLENGCVVTCYSCEKEEEFMDMMM